MTRGMNNLISIFIMKGCQYLKLKIKCTQTPLTPGPNNMTWEMIMALDDTCLEKAISILNTIYVWHRLYVIRSIQISTHCTSKETRIVEWDQHYTIILLSHITKLILRIINLRIQNKIGTETTEERCGFVEHKNN